MLINYQQLTRLLLADATFAKFNDFDLVAFINQARTQVAAGGRCIRQSLTIPLSAGTQVYAFTSATGLSAGVSGIFHIRQAWWQFVGGPGQIFMYPRPHEWFALYSLNTLSPVRGQPKRWAQYGQGVQGSLVIDPAPDIAYTLIIDAVGVPIPLVNDATVEAIPDIWTLPVPFYAAWYALQTAQQHDAADKMMQRFQEQMGFSRMAANPDLMMENWSQSPDAEQANRLGVQMRQ